MVSSYSAWMNKKNQVVKGGTCEAFEQEAKKYNQKPSSPRSPN